MRVIYTTDWKLLRQQKAVLLDVLEHPSPWTTKKKEALTGILHLIDALQDEAVASGIFTEREIFNP